MTRTLVLAELRLRRRLLAWSSLAIVAIAAIVGALFPAFGDVFAEVELPPGLAELVGGGDTGTLAGWLRMEFVTSTGPLIVGGVAITAATATLAGEEERGALGLVLAHPVSRTRVVLAKAAGVGLVVIALGAVTWLGLLLAVLLAGGGLGAGPVAAQVVHLVLLAAALGALALALAAATGRRGVAAGGAGGIGVLMFVLDGLAAISPGTRWLRHLTFFEPYAGSDPLTNGLDAGGLALLVAATGLLVALAVLALRRRDLRN